MDSARLSFVYFKNPHHGCSNLRLYTRRFPARIRSVERLVFTISLVFLYRGVRASDHFSDGLGSHIHRTVSSSLASLKDFQLTLHLGPKSR